MYNPKDIFTEGGLEDYNHHLYNLKEALFFLTNNADDLGIGSKDEKQTELLDEMWKAVETWLKEGDGEKRDD